MKSNRNSPPCIKTFSTVSFDVVENNFCFFFFPKDLAKGFYVPLNLKLLFLMHYRLLLKIFISIIQLIQKLLGEEGRHTECKFNILRK